VLLIINDRLSVRYYAVDTRFGRNYEIIIMFNRILHIAMILFLCTLCRSEIKHFKNNWQV